MHEAVSDILIDRAREADSIGRALTLSVVAHGLLLALVVLLPRGWLASPVETEQPMMTISLGGAPGPDAGGMTTIADRAVQRVAPPEEKAAPSRPAEKPPEMVEPTPAKTPPRTKPFEKSADKSSSRKPTSGAEIKSGSANVPTGGAPVPFGGLSTGGGGAGAAFTDYANFCCPSYLNTMVQLIQRNWNSKQGASGMVLMKFTVLRDGRIVNIEHEKPSNVYLLDVEAQRALTKTSLPPLPAEFPEDRLTVHLYFQYQR